MDPTSETPSATTPDRRLVGSDRVLAVLVELSRHPAGIGLEDLARIVDSPKSSVHRALASLRRAQLAEQDGRGHYVLGDEFVRMAFSHHEARPDHVRVRPLLTRLAEHFGETVHYTVLAGRSVIYRSKVDPPTGAVKLTSTVGGRNPAHATGAGKLLLSQLLITPEQVADWVQEAPLERRTPATITGADELHAELAATRRRGYGIDDQETEPGVNCLALPVYLTTPSIPSGAISVSGLTYRMPIRELIDRVEEMRAILGSLGAPVP